MVTNFFFLIEGCLCVSFLHPVFQLFDLGSMCLYPEFMLCDFVDAAAKYSGNSSYEDTNNVAVVCTMLDNRFDSNSDKDESNCKFGL